VCVFGPASRSGRDRDRETGEEGWGYFTPYNGQGASYVCPRRHGRCAARVSAREGGWRGGCQGILKGLLIPTLFSPHRALPADSSRHQRDVLSTFEPPVCAQSLHSVVRIDISTILSARMDEAHTHGRKFTSTFYGVSWHKSSQRWAVQIRHGESCGTGMERAGFTTGGRRARVSLRSPPPPKATSREGSRAAARTRPRAAPAPILTRLSRPLTLHSNRRQADPRRLLHGRDRGGAGLRSGACAGVPGVRSAAPPPARPPRAQRRRFRRPQARPGPFESHRVPESAGAAPRGPARSVRRAPIAPSHLD
jgi:hypothetical protein